MLHQGFFHSGDVGFGDRADTGGEDAGADLVQGYTAFLYEGPFWAGRITAGLARSLRG